MTRNLTVEDDRLLDLLSSARQRQNAEAVRFQAMCVRKSVSPYDAYRWDAETEAVCKIYLASTAQMLHLHDMLDSRGLI